jgi:hypothetical protein
MSFEDSDGNGWLVQEITTRQSEPVQLALIELIGQHLGLHLSLIADQGTAQGNA